MNPELDAQYQRRTQPPAPEKPTLRVVGDKDMEMLADVLNVEVIRITYVVSHLEELHPDPSVSRRMFEIGLARCGCKVYADPKSKVRVLAHNSAYGCFL